MKQIQFLFLPSSDEYNKAHNLDQKRFFPKVTLQSTCILTKQTKNFNKSLQQYSAISQKNKKSIKQRHVLLEGSKLYSLIDQ